VCRSQCYTVILNAILAGALSFSASAAELDQLIWLSGCWGSGGDNQRTTEHWMKPSGTTMLGMSHTVAGGKTRDFEFMRIVQEENGDIYFVAMPSGQKETRFKLINAHGTEAIFENPAHDFPQRVIYRRDGDSLRGRIEGVSKGQAKAVDFPLKRTPCD
jgi:hypothetical protein